MADGRFDVTRCRADFPALGARVHGRPLVYLDSAATAQKPQAVIDAVARHDAERTGAVHRGVHALGEAATAAYEGARATVAKFLAARSAREVVFTRGTTEAINLVANALAPRLDPGDQVLVTEMEHHSNIVPWQMVCAQRGADLRVAPVDAQGRLEMAALAGRLGPRTRVVAVTHASNVAATINPIARLASAAHTVGALLVVDGAQGVPHLPVDVGALGCDFYAFSGHKLYGPTGIGALWGRAELLAELPPWQGGGEMIHEVTFARTTYAPPPHRFEAGTPNTSGAVGLAAAIDWLGGLDRAGVAAHEQALAARAAAGLAAIPGVRILGGASPERVSLVTFTLDGVHPHDVGTVLDRAGVAVRTGHMCAQPLLRRLGVGAAARASFAVYNTEAEVDALCEAVAEARRVLA